MSSIVPLIRKGIVYAHIIEVLLTLADTSKHYKQVLESVESMPVTGLRRSSFRFHLNPLHTVHVHKVDFPEVVSFGVSK